MKKLLFLLALTSLLTINCFAQKGKESVYYVDSIFSQALQEYRLHNIYLPKDFDPAKKYKIVYATDGGNVRSESRYRKIFDELIDEQLIGPIIFVSSYCNDKPTEEFRTLGTGKKSYLNYRNFEYIEGQTTNPELSKLFGKHMTYFSKELIYSVEKKLNIKVNRDDRIFYGFSNGAGFGSALLYYQPELIGTYFCFSIFGSGYTLKPEVSYPKLILRYGVGEGDWMREENEAITKQYQKLNQPYSIQSFNGGHDYRMWHKEFLAALKENAPYRP